MTLSDTLRQYGTGGLVPRPDIPWYRRAMFYSLRTLFEGPTTTFAGLMLFHSIFWVMGVFHPTWPLDIVLAEGLARVIDPKVYGLLFIALTAYQMLCHTVLNCGPVWRTLVAALVLFVTAQTALVPIMSIALAPSLVMAGNYTVCAIAFLVLSRSFPTWTSRETYTYGGR